MSQSEPLFLSRAELQELTGYKLPAFQRDWLKKRGWTFELNANKWPIVSREHALARLGARRADAGRAYRPNLEALDTRR